MALTPIDYAAGQDNLSDVYDKTNVAIAKVNQIDADLDGGTTGQVLRKSSNTDYDYEWSDNNDTQAFVTTTTNNGQTVTGSSSITITGLTNYFRYYIRNKVCRLDFDIQFTVTSGAVVTYLRIPLPTGVTKTITGLDPRYSNKGVASYAAPLGTTTFAACMVHAIDNASDGQHLQITRIDESLDITVSNVAVTIKGHIDFLVD